MRTLLFAALFCSTVAQHVAADLTVTFGTGGNLFTMDFVPIGNPGNAADDVSANPDFAGSVAYGYNMGKYEVSRDMVTKASAAGGLGIVLADMTSFGGNGANRPATGVTWNEAARFVNWLNTSQGFTPAYKFATQPGDVGYDANQNISLWVSGDSGFDASNPFRNGQAHYVLPSVNEWYKAAYYNPGTGTYFDYPTGSNTAPTAVASGTAAGTAVYDQFFAGAGPADIAAAGGLSPYGTMGQGGNVYEWEETESDLVNNSPSSSRGLRGANWNTIAFNLSAPARGIVSPTVENVEYGFRVVNIPEPSSLLCCGVVLLSALLWKWFAAKAGSC